MESFILKIDHFQISSNIIHISDIKKKKRKISALRFVLIKLICKIS